MTDKQIVRYALENGRPKQEVTIWRQVAESTDVAVEGGATTLVGEEGLWRMLSVASPLFSTASLVSKSEVEAVGIDPVSSAPKYQVVKRGGEVLDEAFYDALNLPLRDGIELIDETAYNEAVQAAMMAEFTIQAPEPRAAKAVRPRRKRKGTGS